MLLFIYMIYVISSISKMKREGQRVSIFTNLIVYGLLILSTFMLYFSLLSFLFSPLPFFGFLAALAIGGMMLSLKIVIALALLLLSLCLYLDSKKSDPEVPLVDHWLRLGVHILLIII
ncbi:diacylglyceryl transferase [Streptococcus koreensis]|uniref:diacylglyceryl transferase n=1 Tax=Streptococcus koreensis TaxID=2382163 RepID=UPI0022E5DB43|nr:diacylglyceryl transferase [Streptococcus koreensis]